MNPAFRYILCLGLLFSCSVTIAQVQFEISVNAKQIGRKDRLEVKYDISGSENLSGFKAPYFKDWKVITGPQNGLQKININGSKTTIVSYIYTLSPKSTGTLIVPPTGITVNGRKMECKPVEITVAKQDHLDDVIPPGSRMPGSYYLDNEDNTSEFSDDILKAGEDPIRKIRDNLFIKVTPSKTRCYLGEPVLVTYKLYTRLASKSIVVKQPSFTGCTVSEMTTNENDPEKRKTETVNGKVYTSHMIRKVQLFPLQAGTMGVGPVSVENAVTFLTSSNEFRELYYGMDAGKEFKLTLSTDPVSIDVLPLPDLKKNTAIGNFGITVGLKKNTIAANETNALVVTISGNGNFRSVALPDIKWPANTYSFDPVETEDVDRLSFPLQGTKTYEIPFEVSVVGKTSFEPFSFTYFDPLKGSYHTISSPRLQLTVTPAIEKKLQQSVAAITNKGFDSRVLLVILPLVFIAGALLLWRRSTQRPSTPATISSQQTEPEATPVQQRAAHERLDELFAISDDTEFFGGAAAFAREMIHSNTGNQFLLLDVLQECNKMIYTPAFSTSRGEIMEKLRQAIA
jgi:hypothetical protein